MIQYIRYCKVCQKAFDYGEDDVCAECKKKMACKMKKEKKVEIILWDWLKHGVFKGETILEVYFNNKKNLAKWKSFTVNGQSKEIPDLVIKYINQFTKSIEYIAVEVKDASKNVNVFNGVKILTKYYKNYYLNKTKYFIDDVEVKISLFILATQYSKQGRLLEGENIVSNNSGNLKDDWINKNVPRLEYRRTKDFWRSALIPHFAGFRKENNIKKSSGLGILISDLLFKFDLNELEKQNGMIGKPIIQCINFNETKNRWGQNLIRL